MKKLTKVELYQEMYAGRIEPIGEFQETKVAAHSASDIMQFVIVTFVVYGIIAFVLEKAGGRA